MSSRRVSSASRPRDWSHTSTQKRAWTPKEDSRLNRLVAELGTTQWSLVAEKLDSGLSSRSGKQCRERWHNHLDPNVKKGAWEPHEDEIIIRMQRELGNQWAVITKMLPGRTDNAVKNRWHAYMRTKGKKGVAVDSSDGESTDGENWAPPPPPDSPRKESNQQVSIDRAKCVLSPTNPPMWTVPLSPTVMAALPPLSPGPNFSVGQTPTAETDVETVSGVGCVPGSFSFDAFELQNDPVLNNEDPADDLQQASRVSMDLPLSPRNGVLPGDTAAVGGGGGVLVRPARCGAAPVSWTPPPPPQLPMNLPVSEPSQRSKRKLALSPRSSEGAWKRQDTQNLTVPALWDTVAVKGSS